MRISTAKVIEPGCNTGLAIALMTVNVFVIAYAPRLGSGLIVVFYALWLPLLCFDFRSVLRHPQEMGWIILFALLACASSMWSVVPSLSLRGGIQYLSTIACALIAARVLDVRAMAAGMSLGCGLVLLYSLLFGQFDYDSLDGVYSFVGAFSSKNQLGLYASLALFSSAALFLLKFGYVWRLLATCSGGFAVFSLYAAQSATSTITIAAALSAMVVSILLRRFSPAHRTLLLLAVIPIGFVGVLAAATNDLAGSLLGAFGKDATLTGRTYLWQQGIAIAQENPLAGLGFQGFWVQGASRAEVLWNQFYITTRTGFHFHNTYIETAVELGFLGLACLVLTLIRLTLLVVRRLLADQRREDIIVLGLVVLFLTRSFVEIDFLNQYTIGTFLVYYCAGVLSQRRQLFGRQASHYISPNIALSGA